MRRASLRRGSLRRGSVSIKKSDELPWDLFDRCLLPVVFSHAAAVIISTVLNLLKISEVSSFTLFLAFLLVSVGITFFYHNLQVSAAGKGVLITSCDNQIGYALAIQLDELGFTVYAGFPNKDQGQKLKDETSGRLHVVELDVTSEKQIDRVCHYILENLPRGAPGLWAVVNNSTWAAFGEFEWLPIEVYEKSIETNFLSMIKLSQILLPSIRKSRGISHIYHTRGSFDGRIINVTSIAGRIPSMLHSPLCAAKASVESFSECIRQELKRWGVNVVIVEPGSFTTGTWFDEKKILESAKKMWQYMNQEAKYDYGEDYFEYKLRSLPEYQQSTKEISVFAVVKSITDACSRTFPLSRYTPVTRQEKLQVFVAEHFPSCIYRIFYS